MLLWVMHGFKAVADTEVGEPFKGVPSLEKLLTVKIWLPIVSPSVQFTKALPSEFVTTVCEEIVPSVTEKLTVVPEKEFPSWF